ncbi:hypothetical protein [Mucilaginibacter gossypiicola]|uniref:hypothetical protein n=1 Tax=Mucilaginibacter gossypiicola TaxID=551995 RepID=UPI00115FEBDE|nr:hypothetical protein [Mucilaginibacter gossypiicola]
MHQKDVQFSVKGKVEGLPVQYLFQQIDESSNPDQDLIIHFSSLVQERKLSKCYLIYNHHIKKNILAMAPFYGIEFLRREDFEMENFHIEPEVPVKYFSPYLRSAEISQSFVYSNEMLLNPPRQITARQEDYGKISLDRGISQIALKDYIVDKYLERQPKVKAFEKLDLRDEMMWMRLNDTWLSTNVIVKFIWAKPAYLIYLNGPRIAPVFRAMEKKGKRAGYKS